MVLSNLRRIELLKKFFIWTITIEPFISEDEFGKPTYGAAVEYKAKIERQERITRTDDQHTIRSRRQIFVLTTDTGFSSKDRLTLPAGFEPLQPKILDVRVVHDELGVHHIVIET